MTDDDRRLDALAADVFSDRLGRRRDHSPVWIGYSRRACKPSYLYEMETMALP